MSKAIDVMIVGVEKAGTTSLLRYLGEHFAIATHKIMEFPYFVREDLYAKGYRHTYNKYFANASQEKLLLAKNVGCIYWEGAASRMYEHNPEMKLIVILRNPVDRAYSAYRYAVQMGREDLTTFELAIEIEDARFASGEDFHKRYHAYLNRGMYAQQLSNLLKFFGRDQIKIILFEKFVKDPQTVLDEVQDFLNLPKAKIDVTVKYNETSGRKSIVPAFLLAYQSHFKNVIAGLLPKSTSLDEKNREAKTASDIGINSQTRKQLEQLYKPEIVELEKITGIDFSLWRSKQVD